MFFCIIKSYRITCEHSTPRTPYNTSLYTVVYGSTGHILAKGVGRAQHDFSLAWLDQPDIPVETRRWRLCCTELSIWEFLFWGGGCRQWGNSIWYCVNGMPQKDTLEMLCTPVCFRILSMSFSSVSIFFVCCYSSVSISVILANDGDLYLRERQSY